MMVTCMDCGNEREIKRVRGSTSSRCPRCAQIKVVKLPAIRRFRICMDCGDVKQVKSKKEEGIRRCQACQGINKRKVAPIHIRTCIDCGDKKECRTKKQAEALRCLPCQMKFRKVNMKPKPKRKRVTRLTPKTLKSDNKHLVERERKKNRDHHDFLEAIKKRTPPPQKISDKDMIDKWLKKNKIKTVEGAKDDGRSGNTRHSIGSDSRWTSCSTT